MKIPVIIGTKLVEARYNKPHESIHTGSPQQHCCGDLFSYTAAMFFKLLLIAFTFIFLLYLLVILPARVKRGRQSQRRFYAFLFVLILSLLAFFRYVI